MKRFLIVCAMALAATVICETRANAWTNFHIANQFNMGFQTGGNRFFWGLWDGGAYPAVTTPQGYCTYPPPPSHHKCNPWQQQMQQQMMMQWYQMQMANQCCMYPPMNPGCPYGIGAPGGYGYGGMPMMQPQYQYGYNGMNNFWAPGMAMYPQMMPMQGNYPAMPNYNPMPAGTQVLQGYPGGQQVAMPMMGNPMMGGYPMVMPPPAMYYGGPATPVQNVPYMPTAQEAQQVPAPAQQIGYVWDSPFSVSGAAPSYWGNP